MADHIEVAHKVVFEGLSVVELAFGEDVVLEGLNNLIHVDVEEDGEVFLDFLDHV
jgi:hypothetical protein